ncbi:hypothetical protein KCU93_g258, partial [Aureobasidium melanogenum]
MIKVQRVRKMSERMAQIQTKATAMPPPAMGITLISSVDLDMSARLQESTQHDRHTSVLTHQGYHLQPDSPFPSSVAIIAACKAPDIIYPNAQKDSQYIDLLCVLGQCHQACDNAPGDLQTGEPVAWSDPGCSGDSDENLLDDLTDATEGKEKHIEPSNQCLFFCRPMLQLYSRLCLPEHS